MSETSVWQSIVADYPALYPNTGKICDHIRHYILYDFLGQYRIESLTADTFDGAIKVIEVGFCLDEAVSIGSEVNKNPKAARELLKLSADAALDGVSVVAVHKETGHVAAVLFNKIQVPAESTETPYFEYFANECCTQEEARSLIRFMAKVDATCDLFEKYNVDCLLEFMFLATLKEHRGKGLATTLCEASIKLAKALKEQPFSPLVVNYNGEELSNLDKLNQTKLPKITAAILTSYISQKIASRLNFDIVVKVPYTEFVHNGKTYTDRIGPESPDCWLVAKRLD